MVRTSVLTVLMVCVFCSVCFGSSSFDEAKKVYDQGKHKEAASEVLNPYAKVNWETDMHICSTTHLHLLTQKQFDSAYAGGLRHFAISNYYPSAPYYPLAEMREDQFKVQQEHPVVVNGQLQQGPFNWNEIILDKTTGWYDEIDPSLQKTLPFQAGDCIFSNIPNDIAESPNAEHAGFTNTTAHINSLGSTYSSGTFDVTRKYKLNQHGYARGAGIEWQQAFGQMLEKLQFADGGGITINHPLYHGPTMEQIYEMLDYDDRVLGIEIWNESVEVIQKTGFALEMWDSILATGRRCYGFSVPDHGAQYPRDGKNWTGRNYLLVPEFNERECLKAYRDGRFYCALMGNGLKFDEISFSKGVLSVKINKLALIKVISDKGVVEENGSSIVYEVPVENGESALTYIRVEATDDTGERIFSQPLMLRPKQTAGTAPSSAECVATRTVQMEQVLEVEKPVLPFVPGSWTLVVMPDTQNYSSHYPGMFDLQTQWIADNKDSHNIRYVLHLGDITNHNFEIEWERANRAMSRLDGIVPYVLVPGNHDYGGDGNISNRTTLINNYFPPERFEKWPTFGGTMEKGRIENNYHLFKAFGREWLILGLEWGPRDKTLQWANQILTKYHNRNTIIITHAYLYSDSTRYDQGTKSFSQNWNPHAYGTDADTNDGEEMWNKLVKKHKNIFMVINGHVLHDGLGFLTSNGEAGNPVHQMLVNFQMREMGGQSWLRLIEFLPDGKTVQVKTYCPLLETYETEAESQFVIQEQQSDNQ